MGSGAMTKHESTSNSPSRAEQFAGCMYGLGEAFRQKVTGVTLQAYDMGLSDVPISSIRAACAKAVRSCQFMPTVYELRSLCGLVTDSVDGRDKPTLAWQAVRDAIRKVGGYASPNFEDPTVNAVVRELGGWVALCDTPTDQMQWVEKRFLAAYASMQRCKLPDDLTTRLTGISEADNVLCGHSDQGVSVVEVRCLSVATRMDAPAVPRIEVSTVPRIEHGEAVREPIVINTKTAEIPDEDPQEATQSRSREEQLAMLKTMARVTSGDGA